MAKSHHTNPAKEAAWEHTPAQRKRRAQRDQARQLEMKKGKVHKGDGKEVDHKAFTKNLNSPLDNKESNLRVVSRHTNRIKQPKRK